jgi:hypothetical protein
MKKSDKLKRIDVLKKKSERRIVKKTIIGTEQINIAGQNNLNY